MSAPRAGWYRDPRNPQNARWWDGDRWTPHTRPTNKPADADDDYDEDDARSPWWRALWVPAAVAGLGLGVAAGVGLGGSTTTAVPGPTVTATVTEIATVPGPTVTTPAGGTSANQVAATGTAANQAAASPGPFGRGLYIVGTDIQAGTYRTAGGAGCYWARLSSLSTTSIIDNSASSSPQTVVIQPSDQAFQVLGNCTFSRA